VWGLHPNKARKYDGQVGCRGTAALVQYS
jgi:hypothetical protein